jgi:hypothetical protein
MELHERACFITFTQKLYLKSITVNSSKRKYVIQIKVIKRTDALFCQNSLLRFQKTFD